MRKGLLPRRATAGPQEDWGLRETSAGNVFLCCLFLPCITLPIPSLLLPEMTLLPAVPTADLNLSLTWVLISEGPNIREILAHYAKLSVTFFLELC